MGRLSYGGETLQFVQTILMESAILSLCMFDTRAFFISVIQGPVKIVFCRDT